MKRSTLMLWLGAGVSMLFLGLLLRKIDGRQLVDALQRLDWRYLAAAVAATFVSYWLRAVRWRLLLLHERPLPLGSLYPAVVIGYMANNLFPARLGEFVRAWVLAEREQLKVGSVFASLVIDRMLDGLSVMVMLLLVLVNLQLPPGMDQAAVMLRAAGVTTLSVYLCVVLVLLLLKARPSADVEVAGTVDAALSATAWGPSDSTGRFFPVRTASDLLCRQPAVDGGFISLDLADRHSVD